MYNLITIFGFACNVLFKSCLIAIELSFFFSMCAHLLSGLNITEEKEKFG